MWNRFEDSMEVGYVFDRTFHQDNFDFVPAKYNTLNGYDVMIMQSEEYTNKIIKLFKQKILEGENPNDCQDEVYTAAGVRSLDRDILSTDKRPHKTRSRKNVQTVYIRDSILVDAIDMS